MIDPAGAKHTLRSMIRGARPSGNVASLASQLLALPLPTPWVVAGVWPLPGEPDLVPVWTVLRDRGHPMVLPETTPRGEPLRFRRWDAATRMMQGRFGTGYPDGEVLQPDLVFVPLLAWDRRLARLGYGGGYYDRTLAAHPEAVAVGFGFAAQEVAEVPVGPYDVLLDAVVTEHGAVTAEGRDFADLVSGRHRRTQRSRRG